MSEQAQPEILNMPDADVKSYSALFNAVESDLLFQELHQTTRWEQKELRLPTGLIPFPRLTA